MDESRVTWGVVLLGVVTSSFTGAGVTLAVLDTGIDRNHPDFAPARVPRVAFGHTGQGTPS